MSPDDPEPVRRLLRAKDRRDAAPQEGWPVARLAKVSGVSEAHFARCFQRAFGVPPHRYLLTCRIERAAALLRDTELPVTEVALLAGWRSLGTFGRTFRAAHRPNRTIAVSEERRREGDGTGEPEPQEEP